ncbi:MAG: lysoplasmalogenase [Steroidobacter sp.]
MNENTAAIAVDAASIDRINRLITWLALASPIAYLLLLGVRPYPGDVILKTAMCALLAVLAWREREKLLALALLFSAAGDAFLGIDGERLFMPGLASFLITQLLYAAIFVHFAKAQKARLAGWRMAALAAIPLFALTFVAVLFPELGGLAIPVVFYMAAIVTMALLSLRVAAWMVPVGAMSFVVSDSLLALDKFLWSAPWISPAIWMTYALAQLLIVYGLLQLRRCRD